MRNHWPTVLAVTLLMIMILAGDSIMAQLAGWGPVAKRNYQEQLRLNHYYLENARLERQIELEQRLLNERLGIPQHLTDDDEYNAFHSKSISPFEINR